LNWGDIMVRGFEDWFRTAYLVPYTTSSFSGDVGLNPGEEKTILEISGKGELLYAELWTTGNRANENTTFIIESDGNMVDSYSVDALEMFATSVSFPWRWIYREPDEWLWGLYYLAHVSFSEKITFKARHENITTDPISVRVFAVVSFKKELRERW